MCRIITRKLILFIMYVSKCMEFVSDTVHNYYFNFNN